MKRFVLTVGWVLWATLGFGDSWTHIGDESVSGISTLSASQTWLCAASGRINFYDGETLSEQANLAQDITLSLQDIHALDSEHVWAVGYSYNPSPAYGYIYFYDGSDWTLSHAMTNAGETTALYGIYAADSNHIWACGNLGQVWGSEDGGGTWTLQYESVDNKRWHSIDGTDASHVWAAGIEYAGNRAQILFFDGSNWHIPYSESLGGSPLVCIDAVTTNDAWAIGGTNGTVLRFQNGLWEQVAPLNSTNANTYSISRTPYGDTWASAFGQGLFYLDGDAWLQETNIFPYSWRIHASTWYVFVRDTLYGLYVRQIYPEVDRIESGIGFSWNSVPGRTYQVEWADDPLAPDWKAADLIIAGGWTTYWGDIGDGTTNRPSPSADRQRVYRVVQP